MEGRVRDKVEFSRALLLRFYPGCKPRKIFLYSKNITVKKILYIRSSLLL